MLPHPPGPPLTVNVSGQGEPGSLSLDWTAPGPGWSGLVRLTPLSPLGSPEGPQLQALTNASSVEFQGLEPGSAHRLEVTALRPCGQNATVVLTAHAGARPAGPGAGRAGGQGRGLSMRRACVLTAEGRRERWPLGPEPGISLRCSPGARP